MNGMDDNVKKPKGTGFTNINDIVRANRENRLGSAVSGGIQGTVSKGKENLSNIQNQFQQKAQAGAIGGQQDQQYVQQTIQNAGQGTSQEDADRFAKLRAGYQGPQGLEDKGQLEAQRQDLQGIASATGNPYGQRGLLQRYVGQPQYSQGQQRLDSLLLGQTSAQGLKQARRESSQFGRQLTDAERQAQAQAMGLTQQGQQFGQAIQGQLGQAETNLQNQLNTQATQKQAQSQATYDALKALLTKPNSMVPQGGVTTMPVGGLKPGITQEQYDQASALIQQNPDLANGFIYGVENYAENPEQILGSTVPQATAMNIATEQDKARAQALSKLAGRESTIIGPEQQIGGYNPLEFLNREQWQKAVNEGMNKNISAHNAINKEQAYSPVFSLEDAFRSAPTRYSNPVQGTPNPYLQNQINALQQIPGDQRFSDLANYLTGIQQGRYQFGQGGGQPGGQFINPTEASGTYMAIPGIIDAIKSAANTGRTDLKANPEQTLLQRLQGLIR